MICWWVRKDVNLSISVVLQFILSSIGFSICHWRLLYWFFSFKFVVFFIHSRLLFLQILLFSITNTCKRNGFRISIVCRLLLIITYRIWQIILWIHLSLELWLVILLVWLLLFCVFLKNLLRRRRWIMWKRIYWVGLVILGLRHVNRQKLSKKVLHYKLFLTMIFKSICYLVMHVWLWHLWDGRTLRLLVNQAISLILSEFLLS